MSRTILKLGVVAGICFAPSLLHAQFDFTIAGRPVQIHSFGSQGFSYSNDNNYLTMKSSKGSFAMTDFGANISMSITDKFRVGAQIYDRNVGNLGDWHPQLDWATADYRFKDWFGIRGGVNKTTFGLHNDTQDMEFLHTFALLPQSIYPSDLRDALIRHTGGDLYGNIQLKRFGSLAYTAFAGQRQDSPYGGYIYLLKDRGVNYTSYGGLQYGADLRWNTPIAGLLAGASVMREEITGTGTGVCVNTPLLNCTAWLATSHLPPPAKGAPAVGPTEEHSNKDQTRQFYAEYTKGNLKIDWEHRRYFRDQQVWNGLYNVWGDTRGWYVSGTYRISKRLEVGSYYSHLSTAYQRGWLPPVLDTDGPAGHIADKVVTARVDLTSHWNFKVEGHFMDGYNNNQYPGGFYTPDNPQGLAPKTNLLMLRTGFNF